MKDFNDFLISLGKPELARDLEKKFTMFVKNFDDTKWGKKLAFPATSMEKLDGVCGLVFVHKGLVKAFSRTGRVLNNVDHLLEPFKHHLVTLNDKVFMVEVCNSSLSLEQVSGIVNPNRNKPLEEDLEEVWLSDSFLGAYDLVHYKNFIEGKETETFTNRLKYLLQLCHSTYLNLDIPDFVTVDNEEEFESHFQQIVDSGGEGVVLVQENSPWIAGYKNHHKTKKVRGYDVDLEVLDVIEGTGKHKGMAGKLLVRWRKFGLLENKAVKLPVDGRFTEEERILMLENPTHYIGSIVYVHALQIGSAGSLRLAKVRSFRIDKDFADL